MLAAANIDEGLLAHLLLTSSCVAQGQGPILVCGPGIGDPFYKAMLL